MITETGPGIPQFKEGRNEGGKEQRRKGKKKRRKKKERKKRKESLPNKTKLMLEIHT